LLEHIQVSVLIGRGEPRELRSKVSARLEGDKASKKGEKLNFLKCLDVNLIMPALFAGAGLESIGQVTIY